MTKSDHPRLVSISTAATLRRWVFQCGGNPLRLRTYAWVGAGALPLLSCLFSYWLFGRLDQVRESSGMVKFLGLASLWMVYSMLTIVLKSSGLERSAATRLLRVLPLTPGITVACLNIPIALMLLVTTAIILPPITSLILGFSGGGLLPTVFFALGASTGGALAGLVLISSARRFTQGFSRLWGLAYPLAVALWAILGALGGLWLTASQNGNMSIWFGIVEGLTGWPALARLAAGEHGPATPLLLLSHTILLSAATAWLLRVELPISTGANVPLTPLRSWRGENMAPLIRLELHRLLRNRRIVGTLLVGPIFGLCATTALTLADVEPVAPIVEALLFPLAAISAQVCILGRGLSARHRPYPLVVGFSPSNWAFALTIASVILYGVVWLPTLTALALNAQSLVIFTVGLTLGLFVASAGTIVGFVLLPSLDNTAGELVGLGALGVGAMAISQSLAELLGSNAATLLSPLLGIIGLVGLFTPGVIEAIRWRRDVLTPRVGAVVFRS